MLREYSCFIIKGNKGNLSLFIFEIYVVIVHFSVHNKNIIFEGILLHSITRSRKQADNFDEQVTVICGISST